MKATIFNIMRYSIHDGPGIRTTVFFKGCPLSCRWCHNPESIASEPAAVFNAKKCIKCGNCEKSCPTGAREIIGYEIGADELMREIARDTAFYEQSGGGVTFSGGEPFYQADFLLEMLRRCREEYIHTAVDTSGFCEEGAVLEAAKLAGLFLYDIKTMDENTHIEYCGVPNSVILRNLELISSKGGAKIFLRVPVIPGVNHSMKDMRAIADFAKDLRIERVYLLPYHNIQSDKYARLGLTYRLEGIANVENEELGDYRAMFESRGLTTKIGG